MAILEDNFFVIRYSPGYDYDAKKALKDSNVARNKTMGKYPHFFGTKVEVFLYDVENDKVNRSRAFSDSNLKRIHILVPSKYNENSSIDRFRITITHEYSHIPFMTDIKYNDCPKWFIEGFAQYISEQFYKKEMVEVNVKKGNIPNFNKIIMNHEDAEAWGAFIVKYMYDKYGRNKVIRLIKSKADSFEKAFSTEFRVTIERFEEEWAEWIKNLLN